MFFFKKPGKAPVQQADSIRVDIGQGFYYRFCQKYNGMGGYRDCDIWLMRDSNPRFSHCIVDEAGVIQDFPGFNEGDWMKDAEYPLENVARFGFSVSAFSQGKAKVSWNFQPDGWYYADSQGFGAEKDEEIRLYSYINKKGKFLVPFFHSSQE